MARETGFDRELADLPPELRWREWLRRVEAVLFASAAPVGREDLARVVGQGSLTFMSDRAARRLCDRSVELGVVRELTGRDTFRLYGV